MPRPIKQSRELRAIAARVLASAPPSPAAIRAQRIADEEETALIRQTMSILGSRTSPAKRRAVRANGKLGGRPKKGTNP